MNEQLKTELANVNIPSNITIRDLILINLDIFILHYYNFKEDTTLLSTLIDNYLNGTAKDLQKFLSNPNSETYTIAYRSFDIEYLENYADGAKDYPSNFVDDIYEMTGIDNNFLNQTF